MITDSLRGQIDLDDGQVGLQVAGDQRGHGAALVGQRDLDLADALDHVVIGEDVAARIDDHARAHAVDAAGGLAAGGRGPRWPPSSRRGC